MSIASLRWRFDAETLRDVPEGPGVFTLWSGPALAVGRWLFTVMLTVSAVGSGSILFTPRVGSEYGYELLWLLWGVALLMWVMIREAGRFAVLTGRTLLDGLRDHDPAQELALATRLRRSHAPELVSTASGRAWPDFFRTPRRPWSSRRRPRPTPTRRRRRRSGGPRRLSRLRPRERPLGLLPHHRQIPRRKDRCFDEAGGLSTVDLLGAESASPRAASFYDTGNQIGNRGRLNKAV